MRGLEAGGDSYLLDAFICGTSCCACARDLAALGLVPQRLGTTAATAVLSFGGNEVDFRAFRAPRLERRGARKLTRKAMILKVLAEHDRDIVSRESLLERVWDTTCSLPPHGGQFHPAAAQALRSGPGKSAPLPHGGASVTAS